MEEDKRQIARTQGRYVRYDKNESSKKSKNFHSSDRKRAEDDSSFDTERNGENGEQVVKRSENSRRSGGKNNSFERNHSRYNTTPEKSENKSPKGCSRFDVSYQHDSSYKFTQLELPKKAEVISLPGQMVLSQTNTGESRIFYEPELLPPVEAHKLYKDMEKNVRWNTKNVVINGVEIPQPRLVAWYGPLPYSYSGVTLEPQEFPAPILDIKRKVEERLKKWGVDVDLNSVLLNLYRDGKDSVAWHSDDEISMGISPTIASVSLGEIRRFEMRRKPPPDKRNFADAEYVVHLQHGSLIVMDGVMQADWEHRVPKEFHDKKGRINLTFRTVYPIESVPRSSKYLRSSYGSPETADKKEPVSAKPFKMADDMFPSLTGNTSSSASPKPQRQHKMWDQVTNDSQRKNQRENVSSHASDSFDASVSDISEATDKANENSFNSNDLSDVSSKVEANEIWGDCDEQSTTFVTDKVCSKNITSPESDISDSTIEKNKQEYYHKSKVPNFKKENYSREDEKPSTKNSNFRNNPFNSQRARQKPMKYSSERNQSNRMHSASLKVENSDVSCTVCTAPSDIKNQVPVSDVHVPLDTKLSADAPSFTPQNVHAISSNISSQMEVSSLSVNSNLEPVWNSNPEVSKYPLEGSYAYQSDSHAPVSIHAVQTNCIDQHTPHMELNDSEKEVEEMYHLYDYLVKNISFMFHRDQEELRTLISIIESSESLDIEIVVIINKRIHSILENWNERKKFGPRTVMNSQFYNNRGNQRGRYNNNNNNYNRNRYYNN